MLRGAIVAACLLPLLGGSARAHDPDWKEGTADAPGAEAAPQEAPREGAPETEHWPDPFSEERSWGPIALGAAAGYFLPWQGNGGYAFTGNLLVSSPTGKVRLGAEMLYRSYETRIFDVNDVDVDSYEVNFVFHYLFNPKGVTPYLGFVTGFQVNKLRKTEVQDERPGIKVTDDVGAGWGLAAVLGLEVPLGDHFALYGEARAGIAYQQTSDEDDDYRYNGDYDHYDSEDLGGATGVVGVRYRF